MHQDKIRDLRPPRLGRWILSLILPIQLKPTASADFEEIYGRILKESGVRKAKVWYWKNILMSAIPFLFTTIHWRYTMIKEYLKLTFRHIRRNKGTALVNIGGLAVGLAACILVFYFIRNEFSFDRFNTHIDSIYEVKSTVTYSKGSPVYLETEGPVGPTLAADFSEVEASTRLAAAQLIVQSGEKVFEQKGIGVDPSFFDVFSFPLIHGHAASALMNPDSVVLSMEAARLCFGSADPMGKMISIKIADETAEYEVTGIAREIPTNSSLQFDLLLPIHRIRGLKIDQWKTGLDAACFIRLRKDSNPDGLEAKFQNTIDTFLCSDGITGSHYLFPFAEYHKGAGSYPFSSVLEPRSSSSYSYILAGIALLVLLIAGFNFMNLSIAAAASGRIKEIGMRKVLGAGRRQLLHQFHLEGVVLSLTALGIGFVIAHSLLPVFNRFALKDIRLDLLGLDYPVILLILFAVVLGILASAYPGWILSRVRPVDLFRGRFVLGRRGGFNRVFLFLQFAISIFLVITTGFLYRQHRHMLRADLGFNPDRVVVLNVENLTPRFQESSRFLPTLKTRLQQYPEIKSISGAMSGMSSWSAMFVRSNGAKNPELIRFNNVDLDYIKTLGIQMSDGRWFSSEFVADQTTAVVVNEAFVQKFNVREPVGRSINDFLKYKNSARIVGVVHDFHFDSLRWPIQPAILNLGDERVRKIYIRLEEGNINGVLDVIKKEFEAAVPGYPFLYSFLDDELASQYEDEKRWSLMITIVCLFAILIACSGVFALALRMAVRRTKEIGVRKVLGASVSQIIGLLSIEFMRIAGAAVVLAWPAAFLSVHKILANYPYRVPITLWMFLAGGMMVAAVTFVTVSIQAFRSALRSPSESLRHE